MTINIQHLRQRLEDEKKLLVEELLGVGSPNPRNPDDWDAKEEHNTETADLNIKADLYEDIEQRHALTDTLEERLENVNTALKKIDDGRYGVCELCEKEIEPDRLEATAAAKTCKAHV